MTAETRSLLSPHRVMRSVSWKPHHRPVPDQPDCIEECQQTDQPHNTENDPAEWIWDRHVANEPLRDDTDTDQHRNQDNE